MLGQAFFQQYFTEINYNGDNVGSNNTMTLTATPYSLKQSYIGSAEYENYTPEAPSGNDPNDDPETAPDDTTSTYEWTSMDTA